MNGSAIMAVTTVTTTMTANATSPHLPLPKKYTIVGCLVVGQAIEDSDCAVVEENCL